MICTMPNGIDNWIYSCITVTTSQIKNSIK
jgi:hypothetical protein